MGARAGVVVTGTEVLTGRVADRNGPFLAERLADLGVEVAHVLLCGDRPADMAAALRFLAGEGLDLVITSGGLGPTADDLTLAVVAEHTGRPLILDDALEARIAAVVARLGAGRTAVDPAAQAAGIRKQAMVPDGAHVLEPVGTAPGLVVPGAAGSPTVVVLPGPPSELAPMWAAAEATDAVAAALAGRTILTTATLRTVDLSEAALAATLRDAQVSVPGFAALEISTCLRRGEIEMVTRFPPRETAAYDAVRALIGRRHRGAVFSADGATVDQQVATLLRGRRVAVAESCTGGLLTARLTEAAGSSGHVVGGVVGGVVAYGNDVKTDLLGVDPALVAAHGAVSEPVAAAMARAVLARLRADVAIAVTGIAGPGGGSADKPVGTVWLAVALGDPARADAPPRTTTLHRWVPGDRAAVRDRTTTVALHLLRRVLTATRPGDQPATDAS